MPREPSKANHKPNLLFQGFAWRCIGLPFICLFWTLALTSLVTSEHRISYDRPPWGVLQTRSVITQLELCPGREKPHYFPYYSAVKVICCVTFCRSAKQRDIVPPEKEHFVFGDPPPYGKLGEVPRSTKHLWCFTTKQCRSIPPNNWSRWRIVWEM